MSTSSKKMGFVDNFMARNVNISSPDTNAKWATLTQYIKRNSLHLSELYKNSNQIQNIIYIAESNNVPDMLFEFSKSLLALVEAHKTTSAEDQNIFDIVKQFAEVAKSSYDKRVIDMANSIVEKLVALKAS